MKMNLSELTRAHVDLSCTFLDQSSRFLILVDSDEITVDREASLEGKAEMSEERRQSVAI